MAIGRLNIGLTGVQPGGLAKVIPSSVAVGSGSGSVDSNGTVSFSGATSVSINNCFSSTYDNYKIVFTVAGSNNLDKRLSFRLRVNNADLTTVSYDGVLITHSFGTATTWQQALQGTDRVHMGNIGNSGDMHTDGFCDVLNPFLTKNTTFNGISVGTKSGDYYGMSVVGGVGGGTTSYTGFTFLTSDTSNMAGTIRIYGYTN